MDECQPLAGDGGAAGSRRYLRCRGSATDGARRRPALRRRGVRLHGHGIQTVAVASRRDANRHSHGNRHRRGAEAGARAQRHGGGDSIAAIAAGRGLHSPTVQLSVSTFGPVWWGALLVSVTKTAQVEQRCGRV